jgi:hypothetical protein
MTQLGDTLANLSDRAYWILALHPDALNQLLQQAMDELDQMSHLPLPGYIDDGDTEAAGVTNWTVVGAATRQKIVTAGSVLPGKTQSLEVTTPGATDGVVSNSISVHPNTSVTGFFAAKLNAAGTQKFVIRDADSLAALITVEFSYRNWVAGRVPLSIPSGTNNIQVFLGGAASTVGIWGYGFAYRQQDNLFKAPTWLTSEKRFSKLRQARYSYGLTSGYLYDHGSRRFYDKQKEDHFYLENVHQAVTPYNIVLTGREILTNDELWIEGLRRASDFTTFSNSIAGETVATNLPKEMVLTKWAVLVCEYILEQTRGRSEEAATSLPLMRAKLDAWQTHETEATPVQPTRGIILPVRTLR